MAVAGIVWVGVGLLVPVAVGVGVAVGVTFPSRIPANSAIVAKAVRAIRIA